jgi:hypothetical protein
MPLQLSGLKFLWKTFTAFKCSWVHYVLEPLTRPCKPSAIITNFPFCPHWIHNISEDVKCIFSISNNQLATIMLQIKLIGYTKLTNAYSSLLFPNANTILYTFMDLLSNSYNQNRRNDKRHSKICLL